MSPEASAFQMANGQWPMGSALMADRFAHHVRIITSETVHGGMTESSSRILVTFRNPSILVIF